MECISAISNKKPLTISGFLYGIKLQYSSIYFHVWWRWRELVTNNFLSENFLDPDSAVAAPHASVFQLPTKVKLFTFSIST